MRDGGGKFVGLGAVAVARDCRAGAVTIALSLPSTAVGLIPVTIVSMAGR